MRRAGVVQVVHDHDAAAPRWPARRAVRPPRPGSPRRRPRPAVQAGPLRPDPALAAADVRRRSPAASAVARSAAAAGVPVRRCHHGGDAGAAAPRPPPGSALAFGSSGRPTAARTRSDSGPSRQRSPYAAHRTESTRAPPSAPVEAGGEPAGLGREAATCRSPASAVKTSTCGSPRSTTSASRLATSASSGLPADEGTLVAQARPGARRVQRTEQLVRLDRVTLPLQPQRQQPTPRRPRAGSRRLVGRAGVDGTDGGRVGQAGRGVHGVADDGVLEGGLDAGDDLTGVDADPQARPGRRRRARRRAPGAPPAAWPARPGPHAPGRPRGPPARRRRP